MHWLLLNLPLMILVTAMILGIMAVGLYLDYRTEEERHAAMARHPSMVSKTGAKQEEKVG